MHLTFEQKDLSRAVSIVAALLKRSATTMPLLSNTLLDAEGDHVTFIGTDMESMVKARVPATIKGGKGRLTLPADKLAEIVSLLPGGTHVTLEDTGSQVRIACESNEYKLVSLPPDEYPMWNADTARSRFRVTQKQLKTLIDAIQYAIPSKDHRRVLMGGLFEIKDMALRLTATDGKKLSRISASLAEVEGAADPRAVISGKLLADLRRALGDEGSVQIEIGERQAAFLVDNLEFRTNLFEGKYPDCDAVIPRDFPHGVRLNRDRFQEAARRAGVVSDERNKSIILKFHDNGCDFSSMAADVGTFSGRVALEYEGPGVEVAFNYQLLIETLNSFSHPDIQLKIKSEQAPTVFVCDAEPDHLCVLMPIKLAELRSTINDDE